MAVPVVIDGYNLLYARGEAPSPSSRAQLARDLVRWARGRGRRVLLVWDGWDRGARDAHEEVHGDVTVHFTRHGERADAYIVAWVGAHREAVVVSSDRAVQQGARRRGAAVLDAGAFLSRLTAGAPAVEDGADDESDAEEPPGARARGRARWLEGL
jgi:predicted RNA-binding protein with PIN domain